MDKKYAVLAICLLVALSIGVIVDDNNIDTDTSIISPPSKPNLVAKDSYKNDFKDQKKHINPVEKLASLKREKKICEATKPTHGREVDEAEAKISPAIATFFPTNNPLILLPYQHHSAFPPVLWIKFIFQENAKAMLNDLPSAGSIDELLPNIENAQTFEDPKRAFEYVLNNLADKSSYLFLGAMKINGQNLISANSLLLFNHQQFSDEQFSNFVTSRTFSVHEVASAMQLNMPPERLHKVLDNSDELNNIPAFQYDLGAIPPLNLADIAVISNDLDTLLYLEKKGIRATDIAGYASALDHALYNVYKAQTTPKKTQKDSETIAKAQAIIEHLLDKGYRAHVTEFISDSTPHIHMHLEFGQNAVVKFNDTLTQAILAVAYDDTTTFSLYTANEKELVSVLNQANEIINNGREHIAQCNNLDNLIKEAEQLKAPRLYLTVNKAEREFKDDINGLQDYLHRIDPAAVSVLYNNTEFRLELNQRETQIDFSKLARFDMQGTIEFVTRYPLSQLATNILFKAIIDSPALLIAWQSRVEPKPVSSFLALHFAKNTSLERLLDDGLDVVSTDKWGNGMLATVLSHSEDKARVLIERSVVPINPRYGPDALDIVLDVMYESGELHYAFHYITSHLISGSEDTEHNHLSRMARLRVYHPALFNDIITVYPYLKPADSQPLNQYLTTRLF